MSSIEKRLSQIEKQVETLGDKSLQGFFRDPENGWLVHVGRDGSLIELPDNGRREGMEELPVFDRQRWVANNALLLNQGSL